MIFLIIMKQDKLLNLIMLVLTISMIFFSINAWKESEINIKSIMILQSLFYFELMEIETLQHQAIFSEIMIIEYVNGMMRGAYPNIPFNAIHTNADTHWENHFDILPERALRSQEILQKTLPKLENSVESLKNEVQILTNLTYLCWVISLSLIGLWVIIKIKQVRSKR